MAHGRPFPSSSTFDTDECDLHGHMECTCPPRFDMPNWPKLWWIANWSANYLFARFGKIVDCSSAGFGGRIWGMDSTGNRMGMAPSSICSPHSFPLKQKHSNLPIPFVFLLNIYLTPGFLVIFTSMKFIIFFLNKYFMCYFFLIVFMTKIFPLFIHFY